MKHRDQKLAADLLKIRDKGCNPWRVSFLNRRQILRFACLLVYAALWPSFSHSTFLHTTLVLGGGIILGAIFNEIMFIFRISKTWPFTEKVTDWEIVKKLATGPDQKP